MIKVVISSAIVNHSTQPQSSSEALDSLLDEVLDVSSAAQASDLRNQLATVHKQYKREYGKDWKHKFVADVTSDSRFDQISNLIVSRLLGKPTDGSEHSHFDPR